MKLMYLNCRLKKKENEKYNNYFIVSNCVGLLIEENEVFLICQRSFAKVVRLIVCDSTGQDSSCASKN